MGSKRDSPMNVLSTWLRKRSMKVKILLGILLAFCALVVLKFTIRDPNIFYIASESIHVVGLIALIYKLFVHKSCSGISLKSQELTALFIAIRFGGSVYMEGDIHTVLDLALLLSTLLVIWLIMFKLNSSYMKEFDNMWLSFLIMIMWYTLQDQEELGSINQWQSLESTILQIINMMILSKIKFVVPSTILALFIHPSSEFRHTWIVRCSWAFARYLETISIFPQLRYMQKAKIVETFTGYYVFALGISRFFSLAYWIIHTYETQGEYLFFFGHGYFWMLAVLISEILQSFILADFCYYYIKSFMRGQLLRKMPV